MDSMTISCEDSLTEGVETALKRASEQWAHFAYDNYAPFQLLVELLPRSVEAQTDRLLQAAPHKRVLIEEDYAQAAWQLFRDGIETLRQEAAPADPVPAALHQPAFREAWPSDLAVPRSWYRYLIAYLKYVERSYSNKELALLCDLPVRQVITIRNQSLGVVARRLVAWERELVQLDAQREQLDVER